MITNPSRRLEASRPATEDRIVIDDRKQRKKIQNRINQRNHRQRMSEKRAQNPRTGKRPYRVDRWRIESPTTNISEAITLGTNHEPAKEDKDTDSETPLMLPSDHLLRLIHFNVFRALNSNKRVLRHLSTIVFQPDHIDNVFSGRQLCDGLIVIRPLHPQIPNSLLPTPLQMSSFHSNWIDMFPFPEIRDNLIRWEAYFDPLELLRDLVGEAVNDNQSLTHSPRRLGPNVGQILIQGDYDDTVTSGRNGLIVWGEPHMKESWEVTPGFLKKWPWVVEGCEELVKFSNYWRAIRGEEPMQLIVTSIDTRSR
ncbi:hypothetical protein IFM61606_09427 [Aspergillus udagawae]|uniref:BZIP domain-containing protein n=1 Tax=Aspergillus udagawae TaxID=91492 RepID=A0ABQ1BA14_9EURO|nr:hypothetical protein IFM61606_09427 [Aspergillus udagawae]GFF97123.1 hypothetical protein IFM53868_08904 [Aspergillus udagawae]GFG15014.1 hypothetical protein IFM5058_07239 [Aspergillus udagawae]